MTRSKCFEAFEGPGDCVVLECPPEACDSYFEPISVEYECLDVWTNQNYE